MCEEDLKSFDPKLNNDNLIKSLQSLKQFYADLQLKEVQPHYGVMNEST